MKKFKNAIRQRGMTLVEVMVALTIAGMLLMAAMRVTAVASKSSADNNSDCSQKICTARLERLLDMDAGHCESFCVTKEGEFKLKLHSRIDEDDLTLSHESSEVSYKIVEMDDEKWLIRQQSVDGKTWQEVVLRNIEKITPDIEELESDKWQKVPENFAIRIEMENEETAE